MLIYLKNMSKYYQHVKVLKHFHKAGLYAKVKKCKFHSKLAEYLKYILSPFGLTISNNKVKDIQSFLGFANFYHWFIFNYLDIVIPLIYLTWKDVFWKFDFYHDAFNSFKKAFTSALILTY